MRVLRLNPKRFSKFTRQKNRFEVAYKENRGVKRDSEQ